MQGNSLSGKSRDYQTTSTNRIVYDFDLKNVDVAMN
jgi:hypothetical protein